MMEFTPYTAAVRAVTPASKAKLVQIVAEDIERMKNPNKS